jgi:hypothetical protein
MIRIPGSHNYKLVQKNNDIFDESTKVKIKQRWDEIRPKFNESSKRSKYHHKYNTSIKKLNGLKFYCRHQ